MPEKMAFWPYIHHTLEKSIVAIIDAVLFIENAQWRLMSKQHIRVSRDAAKQLREVAVKVVLQKHGNSIELNAIYADAVIAEIMHIVWQAFNVGIIQAIIVIACNEDLVFVRKAAKPFDEVLYFLFSDVACMHDYIGFRQVFQLMMLAVSIRDM